MQNVLSHFKSQASRKMAPKQQKKKKKEKKRRGKKDVTGRIFHGKPTEQNHCELNRVLIQLNQRKAPSKIFKLASKQQQHNNNKSLVH